MEDPQAHRVWDTALGQLQLQVTRPNFDTWLKDTVGLRTENGSFIVGTPSDFVSEWLSAKMGPVIAKTVGHPRPFGYLRFQVGWRRQQTVTGHAADSLDGAPPSHRHLQPRSQAKRQFEPQRFVISDSNCLAAAPARRRSARLNTTALHLQRTFDKTPTPVDAASLQHGDLPSTSPPTVRRGFITP
jgi:chromosomal replication initiation ATPase DnaA